MSTRAEESRPGRTTEAAEGVNEQKTSTESSRTYTLRGCAAAYRHLAAFGLVSEVVVAELQRILREAAP